VVPLLWLKMGQSRSSVDFCPAVTFAILGDHYQRHCISQHQWYWAIALYVVGKSDVIANNIRQGIIRTSALLGTRYTSDPPCDQSLLLCSLFHVILDDMTAQLWSVTYRPEQIILHCQIRQCHVVYKTAAQRFISLAFSARDFLRRLG
jgi:hypothetical protein